MSVQTEEMPVQTEDYDIENMSAQVLNNSNLISDNSVQLDKPGQVFICEDDHAPKPLKEDPSRNGNGVQSRMLQSEFVSIQCFTVSN